MEQVVTLTFNDWAMMIMVTGSVAAIIGGVVGWLLFERHDD